MDDNKNCNLDDLLIFVMTILIVVLANLKLYGSLYVEAYDANLYISIAENMIIN